MIMRHRVRVSNVDFYLSNGKFVNPIGKVSGDYYLLNNEPEDGKYKVTKAPNIFPFLDHTKGYINACDIDGLTIDSFNFLTQL